MCSNWKRRWRPNEADLDFRVALLEQVPQGLVRYLVVVLDLNCFDEGAQQTRAAVEPTFTPA